MAAGALWRAVLNGGFDFSGNPVWDAVPLSPAAGRSGLPPRKSGSFAPDLIELLAGIARHLAGPGNVGKFRSKIKQRKLPPCYLVGRGRVGCPLRIRVEVRNSVLNPFRSGMATPAIHRWVWHNPPGDYHLSSIYPFGFTAWQMIFQPESDTLAHPHAQ